MSLFDSLFSNDDASAAAQAKIGGLETGYADYSAQAGAGRNAITGYGQAALAPYTDLFKTGSAGTNAYADATGANGAEGQGRARQNFQTDPGYNFQVDQVTQAIDRNRAKQGMLASGNTDADLNTQIGGLAKGQWGDYVSRLSPFLGAGQNAAAGIASVNTGIGTGLNNSFQNQGNAVFQKDTGVGNAQAGAELARGQAANNMWGGIMAAANLGSKALGMGI